MDKITIEVDDLSKVSDGYHTIEELYEHRCLLWINMCLQNNGDCYLKLNHYEGWFLLGMYSSAGNQISYHCPNKYESMVVGKIAEYDGVEFDGHNSSDVLKRLSDRTAMIGNERTIGK